MKGVCHALPRTMDAFQQRASTRHAKKFHVQIRTVAISYQLSHALMPAIRAYLHVISIAAQSLSLVILSLTIKQFQLRHNLQHLLGLPQHPYRCDPHNHRFMITLQFSTILPIITHPPSNTAMTVALVGSAAPTPPHLLIRKTNLLMKHLLPVPRRIANVSLPIVTSVFGHIL